MFFFILSFIQHLPLYTSSVLFGYDFLPQRTYVDPTVSNNKGNKYDRNTVEVTVRNDFYDKDWSTPFVKLYVITNLHRDNVVDFVDMFCQGVH
jgi:hypothetical protein